MHPRREASFDTWSIKRAKNFGQQAEPLNAGGCDGHKDSAKTDAQKCVGRLLKRVGAYPAKGAIREENGANYCHPAQEGASDDHGKLPLLEGGDARQRIAAPIRDSVPSPVTALHALQHGESPS